MAGRRTKRNRQRSLDVEMLSPARRRAREATEGRRFTLETTGALVYLATLVNPVDHRLYTVIWDSGDNELLVATPTDSRDEIVVWGQGALSSDDSPAPQTDCPRSHTPGGVAVKGRGLGLMLYSGLALAAAYGSVISARRARDLGLPHMQECISSSAEQRSSDATKWWREQVRRGFAEERGTEAECEEREAEVEMDADDAGIDSDYIEHHHESDEGEISGVSGGLSGYVRYTFCPRDEEAQVLEAERVFDSGIVLHANDQFPEHYEVGGHTETSRVRRKEMLLQLDMSEVDDPKLVEYVVGVMKSLGTTREELEEWLEHSGAVDEPVLPGIELGTTTPLAQYARNKSHSAAWKRYFGDLATADADAM